MIYIPRLGRASISVVRESVLRYLEDPSFFFFFLLDAKNRAWRHSSSNCPQQGWPGRVITVFDDKAAVTKYTYQTLTDLRTRTSAVVWRTRDRLWSVDSSVGAPWNQPLCTRLLSAVTTLRQPTCSVTRLTDDAAWHRLFSDSVTTI